MKLIVGLGNPGEKYKDTRHNVGYMVVDAIAQTKNPKLKTQNYNLKFKNNEYLQCKLLDVENLILAKPTTFMNNSGEAVKRLIINHKSLITDLYVVHDDLDIPLGQFKIQKGKGPKNHKGIQSIDQALETTDYWRVRVGVDNRDPNDRIFGEEYVLQDFTSDERKVIDRVIGEITKEIVK